MANRAAVHQQGDQQETYAIHAVAIKTPDGYEITFRVPEHPLGQNPHGDAGR
ncbi:hypothetical protein GCM10010841_33160 [Deinococcus aerophilus]|uniref:Uncharacterized protein n=1 Tax=Deinococcus aerophilus TaxID=522488 RepID=A0ABQ2H1J9_9DEIO|nr:hypothetical protein GCM10010841_33160 [Deinococcus aerophilus]